MEVLEYGDYSPVERAAHITMRLVLGEALTARRIANEYGVSRKTAYATLDRASRVIPIHSEGGFWRLSVCLRELGVPAPTRAAQP